MVWPAALERGSCLAANLPDGVALAVHAIESGAASAALDKLVAISNGRA